MGPLCALALVCPVSKPNRGATGCFAYFTLAALYDLGRIEEADKVLFPMLNLADYRGDP
jgi:hypothetical protein